MSKFLEFPGAMGGIVFVNADCVKRISLGTPERMNNGEFYSAIYVYYKPGHEDKPDHYMIHDDHTEEWLNDARKVLGVEDS